MVQSLRLAICLSGLLLVTGCSEEKRDFQKLGQVTRIRVVDNMGQDIRPEITERRSIEQIVNFVDMRRNGWTKPWTGVPVASVRAEFYEGPILKGYFGAGINFFEGGGVGFWSKNAAASEIQQFLDILEVPKERIRR